MDSMTSKYIDMLARADFSAETSFKEVLRQKLFEKSNVFQFQHLTDAELDTVSAAGDVSMRIQMEKKETQKNK